MRLLRSIVVLSLTSLSFQSFAQEETPAATTESSSASIRDQKKASVGLLGGLLYSAIPGGGVEANYVLNRDFEFGLGIDGGGIDLADEAEDEMTTTEKADVKIEEASLKVMSFGAYSRWYVGNSFYLLAGLRYRKIDANIRVEDRFVSSNFIEVETESTSFCLDIGIGNHWTFGSGFYIGGEWLGITAPISSSSSDSTTTGGTATQALEDVAKDAEDLGEKLGKAVTVRLAVLNIGWTF